MTFKRAGFLTKLVVLALLIYMAVTLLDLRGKIQGVQAERDELVRQVTNQQLENQKLADAIANRDDPEMMERVARDRGYVEENETLFIDVAN
ncbi:septum formation initiator family protein [Colidextribacter sp. OB.20]|uniref:FtsB family cell division protein n=1 Tax=Colidextribacter sp. OB.20 TaxID=2304568 RepID=UPI001FAB90F0|nr:septum formation initiator family protein [Colidextribacter sp. OB.20]